MSGGDGRLADGEAAGGCSRRRPRSASATDPRASATAWVNRPGQGRPGRARSGQGMIRLAVCTCGLRSTVQSTRSEQHARAHPQASQPTCVAGLARHRHRAACKALGGIGDASSHACSSGDREKRHPAGDAGPPPEAVAMCSVTAQWADLPAAASPSLSPRLSFLAGCGSAGGGGGGGASACGAGRTSAAGGSAAGAGSAGGGMRPSVAAPSVAVGARCPSAAAPSVAAGKRWPLAAPLVIVGARCPSTAAAAPSADAPSAARGTLPSAGACCSTRRKLLAVTAAAGRVRGACAGSCLPPAAAAAASRTTDSSSHRPRGCAGAMAGARSTSRAMERSCAAGLAFRPRAAASPRWRGSGRGGGRPQACLPPGGAPSILRYIKLFLIDSEAGPAAQRVFAAPPRRGLEL